MLFCTFFAGKSLKTLMSKGILQVHPPICDCPGCRISSPVVRLVLYPFASSCVGIKIVSYGRVVSELLLFGANLKSEHDVKVIQRYQSVPSDDMHVDRGFSACRL